MSHIYFLFCDAYTFFPRVVIIRNINGNNNKNTFYAFVAIYVHSLLLCYEFASFHMLNIHLIVIHRIIPVNGNRVKTGLLTMEINSATSPGLLYSIQSIVLQCGAYQTLGSFDWVLDAS